MEINKWEYKTVNWFKSTPEELTELGKKGWELMGTNTSQGTTMEYIFKRPCGKITMREVEKKTDRGYDAY